MNANEIYSEFEGYYPGFWKTIAIHDATTIKGFFGDYRWLSNFHSCPVWFRGSKYPSSENAYQAAKVVESHRHLFVDVSPAKSKKLWRDLPNAYSAEQWDALRFDVMAEVLFAKFVNAELKAKLLALPADIHLEETNWWGDVYWGVDIKQGGQNQLGILLMKLRMFWGTE